MKITLFGTQPYDRESFDRIRDAYGFDICYHRSHLNANNVALAQGSDAVCIFVNDTADAETIRQLAGMGVKLIALRCAGFNNVDLNAAARYGIPVVRVPAYSPHAVAEHAVALMLALNRKIHRAYWRTRDGNFSLHGLMGFDMYGKTAGIVGTGKIARELILPGVSIAPVFTPGGKRIRLAFNGETTRHPVVASLIMECQAPVNIVSADIREIDGKIYGQTILELPADEASAERARAWLKQDGVSFEEV